MSAEIGGNPIGGGTPWTIVNLLPEAVAVLATELHRNDPAQRSKAARDIIHAANRLASSVGPAAPMIVENTQRRARDIATLDALARMVREDRDAESFT